jgi:hypothetical protein
MTTKRNEQKDVNIDCNVKTSWNMKKSGDIHVRKEKN